MKPWLAVSVVLGLAACGGGGGASAPASVPSAPATTAAPAPLAQVRFTITIPAPGTAGASALRRSPAFVSANTQALSLSVNGGTAQNFGLTPATNPNCTTTGGATTCANLSAVAPPGTDAFSFALVQQALPLPPTPTVLSIATVNNQVIALGVNNQLGTFTLNPVVGSIAFSITAPGGGFVPGTPSSGNAIATTVKDPSGATIIAPGTYVTAANTALPIGLSSSQAAFTFSVNAAAAAATGSLPAPSDSATLAYSGATVNATTTITASDGTHTATQSIGTLVAGITATLSSSVSAADYHITTAPPELDFYTPGVTGSIALAEAGYAGTFTLQSDTCNTTDDAAASGNYASFSPAPGGTGSAFTVTALAAGTALHPALCTATFADANSQTIAVTFSVTSISFGLQ